MNNSILSSYNHLKGEKLENLERDYYKKLSLISLPDEKNDLNYILKKFINESDELIDNLFYMDNFTKNIFKSTYFLGTFYKSSEKKNLSINEFLLFLDNDLIEIFKKSNLTLKNNLQI